MRGGDPAGILLHGNSEVVSNRTVSLITPTFGDASTLIERCIPSVEAQTYPDLEHVIVVDGPTDTRISESERRRVVALGRRWHEFTPEPSWGTMARLVGSALARGDYIAYIDHDDALLPKHVEKLVALLEDTGSDWVYSQMAVVRDGRLTGELVGNGTPRFRQISTQMLLHRAELFNIANWDPYCRHARKTLAPDQLAWAGYSSDWDLVDRWLRSRASWAYLPEVTVHHFRDSAGVDEPGKP